MSSYIAKTKHPKTGEWENASWIDNYFGNHRYGVVFPSDSEAYDPIYTDLEVESENK